MKFSWNHLLTLASDLKDLGDAETDPARAEAYYRSAISRAYYAAFHTARTTAVRQRYGSTFRHAQNSHKEVIDVYTDHPYQAMRGIGEDLRRLRRSRVSADYDLRFRNNVKVTCDSTIRIAQKITAALNS